MRKFGSLNVMVSKIGLGTWMIEKDPSGSIRALRAGLDLGLNHIDTAEMYGSGEAERLVAKAINGRRESVFLASKVLPSNASFADTIRACEQTLSRLGTDHLDLYLLHWRETIALEETFGAFEKLRMQGKIRAFGVSNFDVKDLEEAWKLSPEIACNQVLYHLKERAIEKSVFPWCVEHNIPVVAYSPFGAGDFPDKTRGPGKAFVALVKKLGATPRQLALSFLTRHPLLFAIPKSSSVTHVKENAAAEMLEISQTDIAAIDEMFPVQEKSSLPML
ncbi:MAG: aldo/keto reductase [Deltaproteobacteria bacterium]|nr:aldo/keto reductase [Deltaproteobacteria bacterium]